MKAKVALVIVDTFTSFAAEYAGPSRIAAYLRLNNIPASLIYVDMDNGINDAENLIEQIPEQANIIGFTIYNTNAKIIYSMCNALKKRNKDIFIGVGSQMATVASQLILDECPDIDFVILGDGELVFYNLILQYENNDYEFDISPHVVTRKNTTDKYPAVVDIETMPRISRDFFQTNKNKTSSLRG